MFPNIPSAQTTILTCIKLGITDIVISPGSRNIPLAFGYASNSFFNCFSIVDERSAGFFALGISQKSKKPTILLCTSGSALLNYSPAIAEAFYSDIPLIVISADRPEYKINIGDGQTINQNNVFGDHILDSLSLKQDVIHETKSILNSNKQKLIKDNFDNTYLNNLQLDIQNSNEKFLHEILSRSIYNKKPVHVNIPFEEPLSEFSPKASVEISKKKIILSKKIEDTEEIEASIKKSTRILVLIGCLNPNTLSKGSIDNLANANNIIVLTESTSNLHHEHFIKNIDKIIAPIEISNNRKLVFEILKPDLILTIGGMVISKKIKQFLREYSQKKHFHIGNNSAKDTFYCGVKHIKIDPDLFFKKIIFNKTKSNFRNTWLEILNRRRIHHEKYINEIPFTDLLVFSVLSQKIPQEYIIQIANSSPVRYLQLFENFKHTTYCNRGTSGIDGSTSTAVGYSVMSKNPILLITGDLSFFYDKNGIWNNYINSNFRIIIINNGGGGIFKILPDYNKSSIFSKFIETKHKLNAKYLAKMHGFNYIKRNSKIGLKIALKSFFKNSKKPKILEIMTSSSLSSKVLKKYFEYLSKS